jgi:hypothetical protein
VGRIGLTVLALALLIGSASAFMRTEKLKLEPARIVQPRFDRHISPTCECRKSRADLTFRLRGQERLDVSVVNSEGAHVITLGEGRDLRSGRVGFEWNGRDAAGQVVADGAYRLKVRLEHDRRTILIPKTIHVDSTAPRARVVGAVRRGGGLVLRYRTDEPGYAVLFDGGKRVERGERHRPGTWRLAWDGPVTTSASRLALVVVDLAGNRSRPAPVDVEPS